MQGRAERGVPLAWPGYGHADGSILCRHTGRGVTDGSAAIAVIGGADGPTAIFVTSRYNAQALWGLAVKVFSNVTGDRAELCVQQADHL